MRTLKLKAMWMLLMCSFLLMTACNDDDDDKNKVSQTDRNYIQNATYANRSEIELGQLAAQKGNAEGVKMFGQMMVNDHTTALNELKSIADDRDVNVPDGLDQEHTNMKQALQNLSGYKFDSAYIAGQVRDHQNTISLFEAESQNGNEQRLKDYANKYLPAIRMHLQKADSISQTLSPDGSGS
jgi:putative membrane protein